MPAQIIQTMAFIQIMDIWRPGRSLEDHLKRKENENEMKKYNHYKLNKAMALPLA